MGVVGLLYLASLGYVDGPYVYAALDTREALILLKKNEHEYRIVHQLDINGCSHTMDGNWSGSSSLEEITLV